jgi:hypothetical protein
MKALVFWGAVICFTVWASVAGLEAVSRYQSEQAFKNGCHKTGATRTDWTLVPIIYTTNISYIPVKTEEEEFFCDVTGVSVWRAK